MRYVLLPFYALALYAAAAIAAVTLAAEPVAGFRASATYWDAAGGLPARIQVSAVHLSERDRITQVELTSPDGANIFAHRTDTEVVTERHQRGGHGGLSFGFGIGGGVGVGGGGLVGTGVGIGAPLGGGHEVIEREVRTEAEIVVPDIEDYRINWSFYRIRVTLTRDDGTRNTAVLRAPAP